MTLSVVGTSSGLPRHRLAEVPFRGEALPETSRGAIAVALNTVNQRGSRGIDVCRLLPDGVGDMGDHVVPDAPELRGPQSMAGRFASHRLAIARHPPRVACCRGGVTAQGDLPGEQVRGSGRMTSQGFDAPGTEGVALDLGEVPGTRW